jgi:hypothetical protein
MWCGVVWCGVVWCWRFPSKKNQYGPSYQETPKMNELEIGKPQGKNCQIVREVWSKCDRTTPHRTTPHHIFSKLKN